MFKTHIVPRQENDSIVAIRRLKRKYCVNLTAIEFYKVCTTPANGYDLRSEFVLHWFKCILLKTGLFYVSLQQQIDIQPVISVSELYTGVAERERGGNIGIYIVCNWNRSWSTCTEYVFRYMYRFIVNYDRIWRKKSLLLPRLWLGRRHLSFKYRFTIYTYMIKALSNNIWKLSCSLHKRRNSPIFILYVQLTMKMYSTHICISDRTQTHSALT